MKHIASAAALVSCLVASLLAGSAPAHAQSSNEELLRRTQMQLRQSEQERNSLRGELARLQAQLDSQATEVEQARKDATRAQSSKSSQSSAASAELAAQVGRTRQLNEALKSANDEVTRLRADAARQKTAVENMRVMLDQTQQKLALRDELVELSRTRNQELFKVGTDLIALYRDKDMNSLAKREPVLQLSQVKLQNLMQEYEDRLRAARVFPDTLPPSLEKQMQESLRNGSAARSN
jgi:phage-related tail protein